MISVRPSSGRCLLDKRAQRPALFPLPIGWGEGLGEGRCSCQLLYSSAAEDEERLTGCDTAD